MKVFFKSKDKQNMIFETNDSSFTIPEGSIHIENKNDIKKLKENPEGFEIKNGKLTPKKK